MDPQYLWAGVNEENLLAKLGKPDGLATEGTGLTRPRQGIEVLDSHCINLEQKPARAGGTSRAPTRLAATFCPA